MLPQAYLLATRDPLYQELAERIHSMYFLATPHRGADSAQTLSRILSSAVVNSARAFVDDLVPNSTALQAINDEFRHVSKGLRLWSFFEGIPTVAGPKKFLVVEKDSAVMGE